MSKVRQTFIYKEKGLNSERLDEDSSGPRYNAIAGAGRVSQQFSAETPLAKKAWDVLLVIMLFLDEILGHTASGAMNSARI